MRIKIGNKMVKASSKCKEAFSFQFPALKTVQKILGAIHLNYITETLQEEYICIPATKIHVMKLFLVSFLLK